jgi:hypothetical protein
MTYPDQTYDDTLRDALRRAQECQQGLLDQPSTPDALIVCSGELIARIRLELHRARQRAAQRKEMFANG